MKAFQRKTDCISSSESDVVFYAVQRRAVSDSEVSGQRSDQRFVTVTDNTANTHLSAYLL